MIVANSHEDATPTADRQDRRTATFADMDRLMRSV
jgi:hypothetical protein